jgi:hypothetical protein
MKKFLSFIITLVLLSSTSCEKEKDIVLSEYVIGEWKTPTMYIHSTLPAWYEIEISNSTYSLMITNGTSFIGWPNKAYSVSNKNKTITIKTLDTELNDIIYKVTLTDDPAMMIWTTEEDGGENFIWEKQ